MLFGQAIIRPFLWKPNIGFVAKRRQVHFFIFSVMHPIFRKKTKTTFQLVQKGGSSECYLPGSSTDGAACLECLTNEATPQFKNSSCFIENRKIDLCVLTGPILVLMYGQQMGKTLQT